ncbi:hypothetical protein [Halorussus amylolyticus]|uniref:hypothetical protein n=1 Tax=Halorussus amylolyticus TaxID=1126242 RepID=UPI001044F0E0|nr:hypothetical protein [Halorussus amylolyticus]
MKRRPFLHLAVGALATAGCLGAPDPVAESPDSTTDAATRSETSGTTEMAASDGSPFAIERVETFDYVVRLNDLGGDPSGGITAFSDLGEREREVFEIARDEGYETDDRPEWLVRFASSTPHVERDGAYFRLEHTFPTTAIAAEAVAESDVDGEIASAEEYETAVTHDGRVMTGLLRIAREEGIDLTDVWPALREFLDTYAAVRYRGDLLALSVEVEDDGAPYTVSATEVPVSEAARGDVWNVSEEPEPVRDLVRSAGETSGAYGFGRAPDGFLDGLDGHEYIYLDGTFYTSHVEKRGSVAVSVAAEFDAGEVRLSLRNDADAERRLTTGAPRPFGVLRFHPVGDPEGRRLLWTDAYAESDHVRTEGREIQSVNDIALASALAPGESVSETYVVDSDLSTGEYAVEGSVGVEKTGSPAGEGSSNLRFRVVFSVE